MKVPIKWLKDYIEFDLSANELGDLLTLSGSNVEEIINIGNKIKNVVTGKVLSIEPHNNADKLVVCQIDVGKEEPIQIVTGADNMKEGDIVPVALHGSTLPGGVKIKKGKLRGVVSNGMMCSSKEIGIEISDSVDGIMILPKDTQIGKDIKDILNLDNPVIDFEITSNRPDCLSIIGIARETASVLNTDYKFPSTEYNTCSGENINDLLKVDVKDKLCKRYMARGIKNVNIESSPQWMQERLIEAGIRPINNIVDITNFVMIELGQPMHAFDSREIESKNIVIERAEDGEKFVTLDNVERRLSSEVLNIKDGKRTVALAGIMGGINSEVKKDTKEIIFECANFDGTNIRVNSKKLGIRTEASSRFEKDIDPNLVQIAMDRACNLVLQLNAGEIIEGTIDYYPVKAEEHILEVDSNWINKFLGTSLSKEDMKKYLDSLELYTEVSEDNLFITVPTFRKDINIKEDVAEEIARTFGYNNIPATLINANSKRGGKNKKQKLDYKVTNIMLANGFSQSIFYSFISPKDLDKILVSKDSELRKVVNIKNPLGEDFSIMRTTSIPSMMNCLGRNYLMSNEIVRLFELGKVYIPNDDESILPEERNVLTIGMYGKCDYLDLKGAVENVLENLGIIDASFVRESSNPTFHPGRTALVNIKDEKIGILGEIHPDVRENYEINERCFIAEINLDILYNYSNLNKKYKPLPKFPSVTRDIALLVDDNILVQQIEDIIRKQGGSIVETIKLFDVYKGKQVPEGKKSIAYSIVYRNKHKTLTDLEVDKIHNKILKSLEDNLKAELRK